MNKIKRITFEERKYGEGAWINEIFYTYERVCWSKSLPNCCESADEYEYRYLGMDDKTLIIGIRHIIQKNPSEILNMKDIKREISEWNLRIPLNSKKQGILRLHRSAIRDIFKIIFFTVENEWGDIKIQYKVESKLSENENDIESYAEAPRINETLYYE